MRNYRKEDFKTLMQVTRTHTQSLWKATQSIKRGPRSTPLHCSTEHLHAAGALEPMSEQWIPAIKEGRGPPYGAVPYRTELPKAANCICASPVLLRPQLQVPVFWMALFFSLHAASLPRLLATDLNLQSLKGNLQPPSLTRAYIKTQAGQKRLKQNYKSKYTFFRKKKVNPFGITAEGFRSRMCGGGGGLIQQGSAPMHPQKRLLAQCTLEPFEGERGGSFENLGPF